jgi:hypothetical protein
MQEIKLSDESVQAIATEVSNQVCNRIGNGLILVGIVGMIVGYVIKGNHRTITYTYEKRSNLFS